RAENHPLQPGDELLGISGVGDEPRRGAVLEDARGVLDTALRVEHEQLGAVTGGEPRNRLRGDRVEPAQSILAGDLDERAVAERCERATSRESPLLDRRIAEVGDDL